MLPPSFQIFLGIKLVCDRFLISLEGDLQSISYEAKLGVEVVEE